MDICTKTQEKCSQTKTGKRVGNSRSFRDVSTPHRPFHSTLHRSKIHVIMYRVNVCLN